MFEYSGWRVFSVAGIDVSVSFWYLVFMAIVIGFNPGLGGVAFALAITLSLLIHEFGHAAPSKAYRLSPSILLHGFGGLCMHQPSDSDWKDILIVVAGPLIEIVVGVAAYGVLFFVAGPAGRTTFGELFLYYFAWVSIVWGAVNLLLPLYPLDGGQLFHLALRRFLPEAKAQDIALKVSVTVAIPLGILAIVYGWFFGAIIVMFLVMDNINVLRTGQQLIDRRAKVRASSFVKDTLAEAEAAFADEDWREAARLCHVLRAANDPIPAKQMTRVWEILALSTANMQEWEEALGWLDKAPDTAAVRDARQRCQAAIAD